MRLPLALAALLAASPAAANDFLPAIEAYLDSDIRSWTADPRLAEAIAAQNATTESYSQAEIDDIDQTWRGQVSSDDSALIAGVLDTPTADLLRERMAASDGIITEVFLMDARGLNVAASSVTSDYWQGDEEKFTATFPMGPDAVHISDVEFDESTQSYQAQVSLPMTDPATGTVIGAITIGVAADRLF
ncbi:MAG: PDC sensor domain-containing protein [Rhodospirillaceae bacterium]